MCATEANTLFKNVFLFYAHMGVFPACVSLHHIYAWLPGKPEEGISYLGTGGTDGC